MKKEELLHRHHRLRETLGRLNEGWDTAIILSRINQYYLTGTMQDGVLVLKRDGSIFFFVRRSCERACEESPLAEVYPMGSYRDMLPMIGDRLGETYLDTECVPVAVWQRISKYFQTTRILPIDRALSQVRAVKSDMELKCMEEAGRIQNQLLTEEVPALLREGMSEAELTGAIYHRMMELGHHGVCRFSSFQTEMGIGALGFGAETLEPTNFDGPGGMMGMSPASPSIGSYDRRLRKGDLVYADIAVGVDGYHTDKTQVYCFGGTLPEEALRRHRECRMLLEETASLLLPGAIPEEIYETILAKASPKLLENFMGFEKRKVYFLGHGVGLFVDEYPVLARKFTEPLAENMTLAIEPKVGIAGVGTVGVEETYAVTAEGARVLTGGARDIIFI